MAKKKKRVVLNGWGKPIEQETLDDVFIPRIEISRESLVFNTHPIVYKWVHMRVNMHERTHLFLKSLGVTGPLSMPLSLVNWRRLGLQLVLMNRYSKDSYVEEVFGIEDKDLEYHCLMLQQTIRLKVMT